MIPYEAQKQFNSCGAAVMKMLLKYKQQDISQDELIKELEIDLIGYTKKKNMREILDKFSIKHKEYAEEVIHKNVEELVRKNLLELVNDPLELLLRRLDCGDVCVINYSVGEEGHYVLAHSYDLSNIIIHDPAFGPDQKISKEDLVSRWISGNKKWKRWFMAVS